MSAAPVRPTKASTPSQPQARRTNGKAAPPDTRDDHERRGPSQATRLVDLVRKQGADLFHWPASDGHGYATVRVGDHHETWRIGSRGFRNLLARLYFVAERKAPGSQALQDACNVLNGEAMHAGPCVSACIRIARQGEAIHLDLCDAGWRVVEVTASGWRVVADPPVRFYRRRGMKALPEPVPGGSVDELRPFLNVRDDAQFRLIVAWLVACFRPDRPFPILFLYGEQGSAKSTTARFLRSLIDPNEAALRSAPRDSRDLMIAAGNGWILGFDNLSRLSAELSDDLCRLATGGGFATRELYSDDEERLFDAMRPVLVTSIEELATRPDLLDRALLTDLPAIADRQRRTEADLWRAFEEAAPTILGALLDAVACALRRVDEVRIDDPPRMADFAQWATAAEPALGWSEGAFLRAYRMNRSAAHDVAVEAYPSVAAILAVVEKHPAGWIGTSAELLSALDLLAREADRKGKAWPANARALSGQLRRLAPNLRAQGIDVTAPAPGARPRNWTVARHTQDETREVPTEPSEPTERTPPTDGRDGADGRIRIRSGVTATDPDPLPWDAP